MNKYIAVVDSGVGGLDILKVLKQSLPAENFLYLADNLNSPFGTKSKQELEQIGVNLVKYLIKQDVKMIVIACNTLSLNAIDKMRETTSIPIYGIVRPTVKGFLNYNKKSVLLIATNATINSHRYQDFLTELDKDVVLYQQPSPKLVEYIEANRLDLIDEALKEYIDPYINKIDALILGCTHFPIVLDNIKMLYPNLLVIDSRKPMVTLVKEKLEYHKIAASLDQVGCLEIQVTKSKEQFIKASQHFFDFDGIKIKESRINND